MTTTAAQKMDLTAWDVILVNSSAGKDSQAMLDYVVELATEQGVKDRITVVHCDLGRVEWKGTKELAERQAAHYGLPFRVVSRKQGDLLDQIEKRGMWPSNTARYCTSDHKRAQVLTLMTALTAGIREKYEGKRVKILNCMGLRAEESPARAKKVAFEFNKVASNGRREVWTWLPIHEWTTKEVWERIEKSGVEHHRAYDLGMGRLSCVFCIFAPKNALLIAGEHNRELLDEYVRVERAMGHDFRKGFKIESIRDALDAGEKGEKGVDAGCWNM